MMSSLSGEITGLRSALSLQTPYEQQSDDQQSDLASRSGYAVVANQPATPVRVVHGLVGPSGDNSDPGMSTAAGDDGTSVQSSVLNDETDGRARVAAS